MNGFLNGILFHIFLTAIFIAVELVFLFVMWVGFAQGKFYSLQFLHPFYFFKGNSVKEQRNEFKCIFGIFYKKISQTSVRVFEYHTELNNDIYL